MRKQRRPLWLGVIATCLCLMPVSAAYAQQGLTVQTLLDRAEIGDLLTRYYYNLGHASADSFASVYAEDAELILGANHYKGKAEIEGAYKALRAADIPQHKVFAFNVMLNNPLIVVTGDTATARLLYTEVVLDAPEAAPRMLTQGREFDQFVRVGGHWRFKQRRIMGAAETPEGWKD